MSRQAEFMQHCQQTLIDERCGEDGQNLDRLVQATHQVYEGTNPSQRSYNEARTVRAVLLGAVTFEALCQHAIIEQSNEQFSHEVSGDDATMGIIPSTLDRVHPFFQGIVRDYFAAFQIRSAQDVSVLPSPYTPAFGFYAGAYGEGVDNYWQERIAAEDKGGCSTEELVKLWEQDKNDFKFMVSNVLGDTVAVSEDILITMGAALCRGKRRVCSSEELGKFVTDNFDVATALSTATRNHQEGPHAALPYGYGSDVLRGDIASLRRSYIQATEERSGWRAYWCHPSLQKKVLPHPGHCPASDYNPLRPRTSQELVLVKRSLTSMGLGQLVTRDRITASQLVLAKVLDVGRETVYQDIEWQERLIKARG